MTRSPRTIAILAASLIGTAAFAADWPQWRGPNRDAHVADFKAPANWPSELTPKWTTPVGLGVATPALVGDKLFIFARQGNQEVTVCLDAATGKPAWQDKYEATVTPTGGAAQFIGPRSSPAVAEGKVVTLDEGATVSCLDAASGKVAWRKDFAKDLPRAWPGFFTSLSPLIADGHCVVHVGGEGKGVVMALDLNSGTAKWKWEGEGPAYASPVLATIGGTRQIIFTTERSVLALSPTDGKLLWQVPFGGGGPGGGRGPGGGPDGNRRRPGGAAPNTPPGPAQVGPGGQGGGQGGPGGRGGRGGGGGGGRAYNAATPIVTGDTVIVSAASGTKAFKIEKAGGAFAAKEQWTNPELGTQFNTPVLKDNRLFGLSNRGNLFCLDASSGKALWTAPDEIGQRGFGSIVSAGNVLLALTPASDLIVFKPSDTAFEQIARIKVAKTPTHAYPVVSDNRLIIKDRDSVMLYEIQ